MNIFDDNYLIFESSLVRHLPIPGTAPVRSLHDKFQALTSRVRFYEIRDATEVPFGDSMGSADRVLSVVMGRRKGHVRSRRFTEHE